MCNNSVCPFVMCGFMSAAKHHEGLAGTVLDIARANARI
ncbi:hypothetical protein ApDm4_2602 [Acetobacter pomorum]|nr:hypothetical protein ApDm4_2602 [Acetobacter pomorum]